MAKYNAITLDNKPRKFPEPEVLGAEQILGRMWHEHTVSKNYTPIGLGEIPQRRSFTAAGEVNPLQKHTKSSQVLRVEDDKVIQDDVDDKGWTPRSILAIMDGVNSVRWALVLLEIGEESVVHTFCDWYFMKVRSRPQKLEQLRAFWDAAGWKTAMGMKSGKTFGEMTEAIMVDVDLLNECLSKETPKEPPSRPSTTRKRQAPDDGGPALQRPRSQYWGNPQGYKGNKGNQKGRVSGAADPASSR